MMDTDKDVIDRRERIKELKDKLHFKYMVELETFYKTREYLSKPNRKVLHDIYNKNKQK